MSNSDLQNLVATYIHAIDFQAMVDDVADFLQLSEQSAEANYRAEVADESKAVYPNAPPGYREHVLEGLKFRFHVSLATRLRYAAIVALVTSIEWAVKSLNSVAKQRVQPSDSRVNQTVQLLRGLSEQSGASISTEIIQFEDLVRVRNCIAHDSGLTKSSKYRAQVAEAVGRLGSGFSLGSFSFMGEQVWVEKGAIEALIPKLKHAVVHLHRAMHEKELLHPVA